MCRYLIIFSTTLIYFVVANNFGPKYPPTKGQIWPKPKSELSDVEYFILNPKLFNISIHGHSCDILIEAIERYEFIIRDFHRISRRVGKRNLRSRRSREQDENFKGELASMEIRLLEPCEEYPYFGMDESYTLIVKPNGPVKLQSKSIWGALRGLESFAQLFYSENVESDVLINKTEIHDSPRYPHRGLLIDTSRHYISLSNIYKTLDAMALNKMNVLHWHIVDDQSFPYQSEKFPDLSRLGAYHSSLVYTKENIRMVINYARNRGIRVIPEFDVPGHTRSWAEAYPNIMSGCYRNGVFEDFGPMNPTLNVTYKLLHDLFEEVQQLFPDRYLHVGGDEVDLRCWQSDPSLQDYMKQHNITAVQLHGIFMSHVIPLLDSHSTPIVWQEVYDEGVSLSNDTLIQVWKEGGDTNEMIRILSDGYKVLYSSAWYLDHLNSGGDWESYYKADPRQMVGRYGGQSVHVENIVGGEACMWGEVVDDNNIISRVWPRASAVAEKLWSPETSLYEIPNIVYRRIEEHTCRMIRRGIPAQPPSGPGFCVGRNVGG